MDTVVDSQDHGCGLGAGFWEKAPRRSLLDSQAGPKFWFAATFKHSQADRGHGFSSTTDRQQELTPAGMTEAWIDLGGLQLGGTTNPCCLGAACIRLGRTDRRHQAILEFPVTICPAFGASHRSWKIRDAATINHSSAYLAKIRRFA